MESRAGSGEDVDVVDVACPRKPIWQASMNSGHDEYSAVRTTGRRVAWMAGLGSNRASSTCVCSRSG